MHIQRRSAGIRSAQLGELRTLRLKRVVPDSLHLPTACDLHIAGARVRVLSADVWVGCASRAVVSSISELQASFSQKIATTPQRLFYKITGKWRIGCSADFEGQCLLLATTGSTLCTSKYHTWKFKGEVSCARFWPLGAPDPRINRAPCRMRCMLVLYYYYYYYYNYYYYYTLFLPT